MKAEVRARDQRDQRGRVEVGNVVGHKDARPVFGYVSLPVTWKRTPAIQQLLESMKRVPL